MSKERWFGEGSEMVRRWFGDGIQIKAVTLKSERNDSVNKLTTHNMSIFAGKTLMIIMSLEEAVCELFGGKKDEIKVIGIRHGEKMYETLLTKEECAKAEDMGNFYRVPADNRGLNYDKFFKEGDTKRATIYEFNSDNTRRLNLEETKEKIASLEYIQNELKGVGNLTK